MNKNSVKLNLQTGSIFGKAILVLIAVALFCAEAFAQDYQMTLNPRRLGHQLGVEI
jgi:hypothetical protein